MNTITISKTEFLKLNQQAEAYKKLTGRLFEFVVKNPVQEVVDDFKDTDLYSDSFIDDLEAGLKKSSYSRARLKSGSKI